MPGAGSGYASQYDRRQLAAERPRGACRLCHRPRGNNAFCALHEMERSRLRQGSSLPVSPEMATWWAGEKQNNVPRSPRRPASEFSWAGYYSSAGPIAHLADDDGKTRCGVRPAKQSPEPVKDVSRWPVCKRCAL